MTTVTVAVEKISSKDRVSKSTGKSFKVYSFQDTNGVWYNLGFKKPTFSEGDTLAITYKVGTYGNDVTEVEKMAGGATPTVGGGMLTAAPVPSTRERSIIRQNALAHSVNLVNSFLDYKDEDKQIPNLPEMTGEEKENFVLMMGEVTISLARMFEGYAAGDIDRVEVE